MRSGFTVRRTIGCGLIISILLILVGLTTNLLDRREPLIQEPTVTPEPSAPVFQQPTAFPEPIAHETESPFEIMGLTYGRSRTYSREDREIGEVSPKDRPVTTLDTELFTEKVVFDAPVTGGVRIIGIEVEGSSLLNSCASLEEAEDSIHYWLVADQSRIYNACSHEDANQLAVSLSDDQTPSTNPRFVTPFRSGDSWPAFPDLAERDDGLYLWHVGDEEDVTVPAGEFKNCFILSLYTLPDTIFQWVCQGVGIVALEYHHHGSANFIRSELLVINVSGD